MNIYTRSMAGLCNLEGIGKESANKIIELRNAESGKHRQPIAIIDLAQIKLAKGKGEKNSLKILF